jgi:hypothetical protein
MCGHFENGLSSAGGAVHVDDGHSSSVKSDSAPVTLKLSTKSFWYAPRYGPPAHMFCPAAADTPTSAPSLSVNASANTPLPAESAPTL